MIFINCWASPIAAGPLAAGFWMFAPWSFFSLLKCVLARWFLDVSFQVTSLTHNCKLGDGFWHCWCPKPIVWQAWWFHFGSLGVHFGTLGHHGGPWEQQEGHVGVWNRIFIDFGTISGTHFESFLEPRAKIRFSFFVLVSRSLFASIFESKSGRLGLPKQGFGVRDIAKTEFSQKSEF